MRCPYCDKYVLKNEIECPNCHNNLILGNDRYGGKGQYRSRFKLLIKFMVGEFSYLEWLGYHEKANEYRKEALNKSFSLFGSLGSLFTNSPSKAIMALVDTFALAIKHMVDFLLIAFGIKYKNDAYGHPICYIDPNKKLNRNQQKKINFDNIAIIESNNLKSFSESDFINSLDTNSNGIATTAVQGSTGSTAEVGLAGHAVEAGIGLAGSMAEAEVGLAESNAEAEVGLAGNTAEAGVGLAGSMAEAGVELAESKEEEKFNIQKNDVDRQVKKCSNCSSINDIDAVYCNKCGNKLIEKQYPNSMKSNSINYKKYALIVVALLILCVGGITLVKSFNGPEQVAKNYISAINKGDYKEAYKYLDVEEGSFINSDLYVQQMHILDNNPKLYGNLPYEEIRSSSVKIKDIKVSKQNDVSIYEYQAIGRNNAIMKVKVKKYNGIIFDDYKIIPDNVYRSLSIEVDNLAKVYVDNILLTEKEETDHSTNIFNIKHIFAGKHTLKVERPLCKTYDESVELDTVNLEKCNVSGKSKLTDDVLKQLNLDTEKLQRKVIECALKNEELTALNYNLKYPDKLQDMYAKYKKFFNRNDGSGIYDLKINNVSSDAQLDSLPYNPFKGRLSKIYFEFEYTRKNRNGMQESRIGKGEGYLTALYEYQNEKLELVSVVNYQLKTH